MKLLFCEWHCKNNEKTKNKLEVISSIPISDNGLVFKVYKRIFKNNKKINNTIENGQNIWEHTSL